MKLKFLKIIASVCTLCLCMVLVGCTTETGTPETETPTASTTVAITETPKAPSETIQPLISPYPKVDGSTATIPLAEALIRRITGCSQAEAEESIDFSTTDLSYYALAEGNADLLLVYEPAEATAQELKVFENYDVRPIGLDALVFIVNEDNPVDSLTAEQIRGIYSGEITNWKEVGGNDAEIVPFQRPTLSGSQTLMLNLMMQGTPMTEPKTELVSATMSDIIIDIAAYDNSANAIGYSVYYYAKNMYAQPGLKFIAVDGVVPSNESINQGTYQYTNPFYGVISKEPTEQAAALLDWLLTEEGQKLVEESGYVPIGKK